MTVIENSLPIVMVVEDCDADFEALSRIIHKLRIRCVLHRCVDANQCLKSLDYGSPRDNDDVCPLPHIILLDLNLPGADGREALQSIKTDLRLQVIPVTVLTSSASLVDVEACYASGANAYVLKPHDYADFTSTVTTMMAFWLDTAVLPSTS